MTEDGFLLGTHFLTERSLQRNAHGMAGNLCLCRVIYNGRTQKGRPQWVALTILEGGS